jgi:hypothetical protein
VRGRAELAHEKAGKRVIYVKVVDVFGHDTSIAAEATA